MAVGLDCIDIGSGFDLSDLLEAQREMRFSGLGFPEVAVFSEEGKRRLYSLLQAQPKYSGSLRGAPPATGVVRWHAMKVEVC